MNCRVLLINGPNAEGKQVASFMNSQGAFSASPTNSLFFTLILFVLCSQRDCSSLPPLFLLFDLTPLYLNTVLLCELVLVMFMAIIVLLKCSQCSEFNFNPTPS